MRRCMLVGVGLVLLAVPIAAAGSIYAYRPAPAAVQADAAIVLGAAVWGNEPSPVFRERINHAVDLYRKGQVAKLIFTGGRRAPGEPADAEVAGAYAMECGVPAEDVLVETRSRITEENLRCARDLGVQQGLRRFIIVSDPLHMKRAMLMARDLGLPAYPAPTPTTRYRSPRSELPFLARETFFYLLYLARRPFRRGGR